MNAPSPTIQFARRSFGSFRVWGVTGYLIAAGVSVVLAVRSQLHVPVLLLLLLTAIGVFLSLVLVTKIILRAECLIYYHHEIAVLATSALVVRLLQLPVLGYLDLAATGLAVFLAFGRLGCAAVGCCYGRPSGRGLLYGAEHVHAGFPAGLCGVCLVPVQWIESFVVACLALIASVLIWRHAPAGSAFLIYTAGYAVARFALEYLRGDDDRGYHAGFSAAQWTSAAVWVALFTAKPILAAALPLVMGVITLYRYQSGGWLGWFDARHIHELVGLMAMARSHPRPLVLRTSRGLLLSAGNSKIGDALVEHYTISTESGPIPQAQAIRVAQLIARLRGRTRFRDPLGGSGGVLHVLLSEAS